MKYITLICFLTLSITLNSKMVINSVTEVNFGPVDFSIFGGIKVDNSKDTKTAGVYFNSAAELIFVGTSQDTIENIYSIPNVTLNKPSGDLLIVDDLDITGVLKFISGNIITASDTLNLTGTSYLTGESSNGYLIGCVKAPRSVGTGTSVSTGDFGNIGFSIGNTGNDIGTVTIVRKTGDGAQELINNSEGIKRSWEIRTSIPFTGTRSVTSSWLSNEDNGNRLSNLKVWKYIESKAWEWVNIASVVFNTVTSPRTATFDIDAATKLTINNTDTYFAGGKGTQEEPYLIRTAQNLDSIRYYLTSEFDSCYFKQIANIDLGVSPWNIGSGWDPIGDGLNPFKSNYDGDNYTISNLTIDRSGETDIGLFGYTIDSFIQNITLNNSDVTGFSNVGALTGSSDSSSFVYNSKTSGTVAGGNNVGGLIGYSKNNSSVESSHSSCNTSAGTFMAGGLVGGSTNYCNILSCSATGTVNSPEYAGGLIGSNSDSYINYCFASGDVTGTNYLGGLIGYDYNSNIYDSYSNGAVTGTGYLGGLIGYAYDTGIYFTYSIGAVTGSNETGGLVGYENYTDCYYSYWDTETSGQISSAVGSGKSTDDMTYPQDYSTYEFWDFTMAPIWICQSGVNSGYPYLAWQALSSLNSPANVSISVALNTITISWNEVSGASGYAVYSSLDPYGIFALDGTGTFNGTEWSVTPLPGTKKFYYVKATDGTKAVPAKIIPVKKKVNK